MNNQQNLIAMADLIQAKDVDNEFDELVENAKYTAEMNPISETAEYLKDEMMNVLRELR